MVVSHSSTLVAALFSSAAMPSSDCVPSNEFAKLTTESSLLRSR